MYGYGNQSNDGLSLVCEVGNISIGMEKYGFDEAGDFDTQFTNLTNTATQISSLTIGRVTVDDTESFNTTWWRLYVPPNPFGECNGTVVFQAESS